MFKAVGVYEGFILVFKNYLKKKLL